MNRKALVLTAIAPAAVALMACTPPPQIGNALKVCGSDDGIVTMFESALTLEPGATLAPGERVTLRNGVTGCDVLHGMRLDIVMDVSSHYVDQVSPGVYSSPASDACDFAGGSLVFDGFRIGAEYTCEGVDY